MNIKLYGAARCHKTQHYMRFFETHMLDFTFLDVEENEAFAEELRSLYTNRKLNFPTITLENKKLRNPSDTELLKWLQKLNPSMIEIKHDKDNKQFVLPINNEVAKVEYVLKNGKMYLVHSEVPYNLRGRGIGKELVLQTFQKLTEEGYKAVAVCSYIKAVKNKDEHWKNSIE